MAGNTTIKYLFLKFLFQQGVVRLNTVYRSNLLPLSPFNNQLFHHISLLRVQQYNGRAAFTLTECKREIQWHLRGVPADTKENKTRQLITM